MLSISYSNLIQIKLLKYNANVSRGFRQLLTHWTPWGTHVGDIYIVLWALGVQRVQNNVSYSKKK